MSTLYRAHWTHPVAACQLRNMQHTMLDMLQLTCAFFRQAFSHIVTCIRKAHCMAVDQQQGAPAPPARSWVGPLPDRSSTPGPLR